MYDLLNIFLAGASASLIGFLWYHPKLFGKSWVSLVNIGPEELNLRENMKQLIIVLSFAINVLIAFVIQFFSISPSQTFWVWFAFTVPALLTQVLWEGRSIKLFLINSGYWLAVFIATANIINYL